MLDKNTFFFDHQSTTPLHPKVHQIMLSYTMESFANPHSSEHALGWAANKATELAREQVSTAIHADKDEIIFTSGASEANNLALKGLSDFLIKSGKNKVIVSAIEHKCILETARFLETRGLNVIYVKPNKDGIVTPELLSKELDDQVGLVSIMLVNNEIGTVQPIKELSLLAKKRNALFHSDAAQAPLTFSIDVIDLGIDLLSLSSHKVYGPKGIGSLFVKRNIQKNITPLIHGGGQENGLRGGTLPAPLCVGFGAAMSWASKHYQENYSQLEHLSHLFINNLKNRGIDFKINGSMKHRHPGNLNLRFLGINSRDLLMSLQPRIAASTGSACNSGTEEPSYVLQALDLTHSEAEESLRVSFGIQQTEDDILKGSRIFAKEIQNLKQLAA